MEDILSTTNYTTYVVLIEERAMNQKKNQRFQETDNRICSCFIELLSRKEMSRITVNEICGSIGINRSSFYLHYADVYALLAKVMEGAVKEMLADFTDIAEDNRMYFSRPYLLVLLRHVKKDAVLYRAYLEHVGMAEIEKGYQSLFSGLFRPYFRMLGMESEHVMEYYFTFATNGFTAVLRKWLSYGCEESIEDIADIILRSMAPIPEGLPDMSDIM